MNMIFAHSEKTGIRAFLPYRSTYRLRAHGDTRSALAAQRVFRFKSKGESSATWRRLVEAAASDLGCSEVWVVPGHDPGETSQLQQLFGTTIRRKYETTRRKYSHKAPVDIASFGMPKTKAKRILLADDVCTSGATLTALRDHLQTMGVKAIPLALGIHPKLCPAGFDFGFLSAQWEQFATAGKTEADSGPEIGLLARCYGIAVSLFDLPFLRALGATGGSNHAAWETAYFRRGLPFTRGREEVEAIRQLTAQAYFQTAGETQGRTHRFTRDGVMAAMTSVGLEPDTALAALEKIRVAEHEKQTVPNPYASHPHARPLVMAWELVEGSGFWLQDASKSAASWKQYTLDLCRFLSGLAPCLMLGYAVLFHDAQGRVWGVHTTDEGREALDAEWPRPPGFENWDMEGPECDAAFASWEKGFVDGLHKYEHAAPPRGFENIVDRRLPASKWWKL